MSEHLLTPSQTVGPYFHDALIRRDAVVAGDGSGPRVRITGRVLDGAGDGVPDAVIEAWQGTDFARVATQEGGHFSFTTVRPVAISGDDGAPSIGVLVFARGLLNHLVTRIYLPDDPANDTDLVLLRVPADRRRTLIARRAPDEGEGAYDFDVVLQGAGETVFFDIR